MTARIINQDCTAALRDMEACSIHCVVTSPPYLGLRSYLPDNSPHKAKELGRERNPVDFVGALVGVMREVRRVLRDDGTLWLNLGDSYSHGGAGARNAERWPKQSRNDHSPVHAKKKTGLKPKDLLGVPWRVALAMQAGFSACSNCALELRTDLWPVWNGHKFCPDCPGSKITQTEQGWFLRQDVIWQKENCMPESVRDRCTKSHEYLFMFSKTERYFFDMDAISEPISAASIIRLSQNVEAQDGSDRAYDKAVPIKAAARRSGQRRSKAQADGGAISWEGTLRNKRSVWTIPTQQFVGAFCSACQTFYNDEQRDALRVERVKVGDDEVRYRYCACGKCDAWVEHFATFPYALVEPCIKAGTSEAGCCATCAAPLARQVDEEERTTWEPTCKCYVGDTKRCTVLDPFGGAGTTLMVADRLARDCVTIELHPDYAEMIRQRYRGDAGLFAQVAE